MANKSGVYIIICNTSNKWYIGSSVNMKKRWGVHLCDLRKKRHGNRHLQGAFNKYGETTFVFLPFEEVEPDRDKLKEREQVWLDTLQCCNPDKGYNIKKKAYCPQGPNTGHGRGYSYNKKVKRFVARVVRDGKTIHLGQYEKEQEAIEAVAKFEADGTIPETKGYCFNRNEQKWYAYGWINGKRFHLGRFDTEEQARKARLKFLDDGIVPITPEPKHYCWLESNKAWTAYGRKNGKSIYLGYYNTEAEAKAAYENYQKTGISRPKRQTKGYSWCKQREKWVASTSTNGKTINLGGFSTEEEAHQAYLDFKNSDRSKSK